jgi:transposase
LLKRIGMPASDDTILRHLNQRAKARRTETGVRVVGVDDGAWNKGSTFGTIVVGLERREVVDVLPDRSTASMSDWLEHHPECGSTRRLISNRRRTLAPGSVR